MEKSLVFLLKKDKEFSSLDNKFLNNIVKNYLMNNKPKNIYVALKDIKKILYDVYSVFNIDIKSRKILLNRLKKHLEKNNLDEKALNIHKEILKTHRSTKERLNYYEEVYKKIFSKIKGNSILDLGSGLNPFSFPFMNLKKVNYIAAEVDKKDVDFLNKYFKIMKKYGLNGKAVQLDLLSDKFLKADVCFLFKVLDSLETLELNISKKIFKKINSKYVVVSFPTKTLRGKKLDKKRLAWFKKLIRKYEVFEIKNEIFYIMKK